MLLNNLIRVIEEDKNDIEIDTKIKCLEAKMTQQQLGEAVGTTGQYVNRIIKKKDGVVIFEPICPRCGNEGKYIATDVRPVFPEERLLLALIQEKHDPHCYEQASVWYGGGAYIVNGEKRKYL